MGLVDFYFIFSMCDVNVVDLVNFSVVYALFSDDPRGLFSSNSGYDMLKKDAYLVL